MKRVIFVEPKIDKSDELGEFFKKYNPDSSFVGMHICLVFPFRSELSSEYIKSVMDEVLCGKKRFSVILKNYEVSYEGKNNYLFLKVNDEKDILSDISQSLYKRMSGHAYLKGDYNPHITVGKNPDISKFIEIERDFQAFNRKAYIAFIEKICCAILETDENGSVRLNVEYEFSLE